MIVGPTHPYVLPERSRVWQEGGRRNGDRKLDDWPEAEMRQADASDKSGDRAR